jgi:hypothetical protein
MILKLCLDDVPHFFLPYGTDRKSNGTLIYTDLADLRGLLISGIP